MDSGAPALRIQVEATHWVYPGWLMTGVTRSGNETMTRSSLPRKRIGKLNEADVLVVQGDI